MIFPNVIRRIQFKSSIDFKQGIPYRIRPVAKTPLTSPRETHRPAHQQPKLPAHPKRTAPMPENDPHETRTPATKTPGTPSSTQPRCRKNDPLTAAPKHHSNAGKPGDPGWIVLSWK